MTGSAWFDPVLPSTDGVMITSVFFAPGSRTHWHRHEHGQILHITGGRGRVGLRDGSQADVRVGDIVWCPPGEEHWHGGGPDSYVVHLAVSLGETEWMEEAEETIDRA